MIGMGAADVYHPLAQNFYVYTQKENRQNSRDVTCHMTFTDKNGSILAECRDVRFRYGHEKTLFRRTTNSFVSCVNWKPMILIRRLY
ncbi:hypothetical protein QNN00_20805 [Bacillus velezensis]|nr:hypothetical protein [Bacillus velezensis]